TGGAAYGMPRNRVTPFSTNPWTAPSVVTTTEGGVATRIAVQPVITPAIASTRRTRGIPFTSLLETSTPAPFRSQEVELARRAGVVQSEVNPLRGTPIDLCLHWPSAPLRTQSPRRALI